MKIHGLNAYNINESELWDFYSNRNFEVKILIRYFQDMDILLSLSPKERRLLIRQKSRDNLRLLLTGYPNKEYNLIGTKLKPIGISGKLNGRELLTIADNDSIDQIIIQGIEGLEKVVEPKKALFYSVQGLFAVNVEGFDYTNSVRFTEERIILVKAVDSADAIKKAEIEFNKYSAFRYLNSDFRLTKWEFIDILSVFETDVSEIDPEGTEIFSICRNRKIKKNNR